MRDPLYTLLAEHIASLTSADDVRWLLDQLLTDAEIREGMEGALCRCMTYYRIQQAIKRVTRGPAGEDGTGSSA